MINKSNRLLFGYSSPEFINLYSEDNPILGIDDTCYFMFTNLVDIHRPMIGYGVVRGDYYSNDMNKSYYIELQKVYEESLTVDRFLHNQSFALHKYTKGEISRKGLVRNLTKQYLLTKSNDFLLSHLMLIEGFFVRPELSTIVDLRSRYIQIIMDDFKQQLLETSKIDGKINPIPYTPKVL